MQQYTAIVTSVTYVGDDIATLYFTLPDGSTLDYTAGQYISVYKPGGTAPEGKAYSLSSAPHELHMSITVKRVGEYSGYLYELQPGDKFTISAAFGYFNPLSQLPIVGISAGVGVAPVLSVIKDIQARADGAQSRLYCSNKTTDTIPHFGELHGLSGVQTTHYITRQSVTAPLKQGRINVGEIVAGLTHEVMYLVCGSVDFVRTIHQALTQRGVSPTHISTEVFFES